MKNRTIILLLIFIPSILWGQNRDYIILKHSEILQSDTVFGEIIFPKNGIITKAKISTTEGIEKYSPNKVIGFKYGERYFASVPYNSHGNVFAERVANGKIDLCYYDTYSKDYTGGLTGAAAAELTSYYFIKSKKDDSYMKVPHSREKARDEIAVFFKDNEKIYNQVLSEEFRVWKLPDIVKEYNNEK